MNTLRIAVIGCGHLGRIHARLAAQLDGAELIAVADPSPQAREQVSESAGLPAYADYRQLAGQVDAAIIATPTCTHARIAQDLIAHGIHVLVEKPLTTDLADARALVLAASQKNVVLAVGHVERFNPAFAAALSRVETPTLIEASRTAGFSFRSTDIGVVFDLMIHDLDLVRALVKSPVVHAEATGFPFVTQMEDLAEARLTFANGCVACLKASRASVQTERRLTVYEPQRQTFVDLGARTITQIARGQKLRNGSLTVDQLTPAQIANHRETLLGDLLPVTHTEVADANPLQDEQQDFVDSIRGHRLPRVTGQDALDTVALAVSLLDKIGSAATLNRTDQHKAA